VQCSLGQFRVGQDRVGQDRVEQGIVSYVPGIKEPESA
jgi:hypothetical protein